MDAETKELIEALAEKMCDSLKTSLINVITGKESAPKEKPASKYEDYHVAAYFSKSDKFSDLDAAAETLDDFDSISTEMFCYETEGTFDATKWASGDEIKRAYEAMEKKLPNDEVFAALKEFPFTDLIKNLKKCSEVHTRSKKELIKDAIICCINAAALNVGSYYTYGGFLCFHATVDHYRGNSEKWLKLVFPLGESYNDW